MAKCKLLKKAIASYSKGKKKNENENVKNSFSIRM